MDEATIVVAGIPRSASTFVWQLLKDLFPEHDVAKVHGRRDRYPMVITYRDLRDVVVSTWKTWARSGMMGEELTTKGVDRILDDLWPSLNILDDFGRGDAVLWLRYEDFVDDHDVIYDAIETFWGVEVSQGKRRELSSSYGLPANRKRAAQLADFHCVDPETKIHGRHIYKGSSGYAGEVSSEVAVYLDERLGPLLQKCGYGEWIDGTDD